MSKIIKITGGGTGIGRATALRFAQAGYNVVISGRREEKLAEVKHLAKDLSGKIHYYTEDVTDLQSVEEAYAKMLEEVGSPDIVFLNAGYSQHVPIKDFCPQTYHNIYEVNQKGVIHGLTPVLRDMMSRRQGHIAVTASVAGYKGLPTASAYCMTKAALINLCEALRPELLEYNVKLQLVCPGFVKTPMTDKNDFDMPFLVTPEAFSEYLFKNLATDRFELIYPRLFGCIMRFYRLLPNFCTQYIGRKMLKKIDLRKKSKKDLKKVKKAVDSE